VTVHDEDKIAWLQRLSTIGQMMSGVLHEVRTPLNTVTLTVEHALKIRDVGGDPREDLETIAAEAERAIEILSDVLDFAKPAPLDLKPVELSVLLATAFDPLKIRFEERDVEAELDVAPGVRVLASERHLHQVATILFINALDAMPFGGKLIMHADRDGEMIRLSIRDTGIGIEKQALKQLFEPFASGKRESGGTGLGLHVARWIMNKHGGDADISSPGIGKGTTVTLTLKAAGV
jgi:two-component system sensor histidine kinase HydH